MSAMQDRLRDEAARDATVFDAALHARVMSRVDGLAEARDVAPPPPTRGRWCIGAVVAAAASIAVGVSWFAWPARQTAIPAIPWEPDRSVARLYAPPAVDATSPDVPLAGDLSRFLRSQIDLATSLRAARRTPTPA